MSLPITLVVIGKDEASLELFYREHATDSELILIANTKGESLAKIANRYLPSSREVFGLCHADAWFGPGSLEVFTQTALEGKICGIVGASIERKYHWCHTNPVKVSTLDACAVFLPVQCNLKFDDEMFTGFHCHVEDMCLQGQKIGMEVVVPSANATHNSENKKGEAWRSDYWKYKWLLAAKWRGTLFSTT